jgi:hypothetical protein
MSQLVQSLAQICSTPSSTLWIRSFNGVDGAMCVSTRPQLVRGAEEQLGVVFGYNQRVCNSRLYYPLCDTRCAPIPTGTGPITGTLTTFTSATRTTVSVRTAVNTITDYVTVFPPRHHHQCDRGAIRY